MGKFTSIIQFKGKVGELVGSRDSKGEMTVRKHQPEVKNPQTDAQMLQRTRFLAINAYATLAGEAAFAGLTPRARKNKMTTRNAFVKLNLADSAVVTATKQQDGSFKAEISPRGIKFAEGILATPLVGRPVLQEIEGTPIAIELPITAGQGNAFRTRFVGVAINPDSHKCIVDIRGAGEEKFVFALTDANHDTGKYWLYVYTMQLDSEGDEYTFNSWLNTGYSALEANASIRTVWGSAQYSDSIPAGDIEVNP